ncbi:NAD-dependent epimerase/dehydratase family protein [Pedobacter rhizosphaerae]|uniref:Nucleoside-diphosphate-sugar epimerase n=1 Tax=Pedobacter rhizosphaerae TaxID=390241 RepID=A0A1H9U3B4_9SPHI|nr:NAD-dependent epimerase/dehydratase family protein [Pedobacter rhizosphaerae]SES03995.1 Nucleoside-diphosphate-sugar epimerase [Pedobacter rhizosphaerae]
MKFLLTGASGFLGKHILAVLEKEGDVITIGRKEANIVFDFSIGVPALTNVDVVVHCAGKAHSVPKTEVERKDFFKVNVQGTQNILNGLMEAKALPSAFVFISTVAVYGANSGEMISENHALNAEDAYGLSKIEAERLVLDWCKANRIRCTILRLPLLVGRNAPGNLGAMIAGISKGYYVNIAGGEAKKSMVLAQDVANIIPYASRINGIFNLTDGYHPSFSELAFHIAMQLSKKRPVNIPYWIAKPLALIGDIVGSKAPINTQKLNKILTDLTFDDTKAKKELNWKPTPILKGFELV